MTASKKLVLVVVDGLGPALLDAALAEGRAPTIAALAAAGGRTDACVASFPSLTPVCLAALVTGEHPAGSRIPSMTWYHRGEGRIVEYGSSIGATLAEGTKQMIDDVLVNLNMVHLSPRVETIFESLEDAGLVTAAVNLYVHRGRVRHPLARAAARRLAPRIGIVDATWGPTRFFFGDLFASDHTGAPRNLGGRVDRHGGAVGRWLVTRDGFDFLLLYLYETDAVQHRGGDAVAAAEGADRSIGMLLDAAGGLDAFLDRYAVVVVADHGQSPVTSVVEPAPAFDGYRLFRSSRHSDPAACDLALTATNRVAMAYLLPGDRAGLAAAAGRLERLAGVDVVLFRDGDWLVARRGGGELRFRRGRDVADRRGGRWTVAGDRGLLPEDRYPNALERIEGILASPAAGDVVASAAAGVEFVDAGGGHHLGGGSHGSLLAADSRVPLVTAGFAAPPALAEEPSITDIAPLVRHHFGVGSSRRAAAVQGGR